MGSNTKVWIFLAFLGFCVSQTDATGLNETERHGKALSVFQVVRFPNIGCYGINGMNGTCYTSSECLNRGGANGGSCANGFGVCCSFVIGCGSTSSENCTFFKVTTPSAGSCTAQICKANPDVCQLRLDFQTFMISGPSADATIASNIGFSNPIPPLNGGSPANTITRCLTDTFSVTSPGSTAPPVICGFNTGQHMYVDASNVCNSLNFNLGSVAVGTTIAARSWNIKVTQISCSDIGNLAPSGCTQYFVEGSGSTIQTFNYGTGTGAGTNIQLANQRQTFCFRICFTAVNTPDFAVSGAIGVGGKIKSCCNYGVDGFKGFDCLTIPGARTTIAIATKQQPNAFCGNGGGLVTADGGANKMICTTQTPFMITFYSDAWTVTGDVTAGFKLMYSYKSC